MRAETDKMMFGNDWPGVFIRGDNAWAFAKSINEVLAIADIPDELFWLKDDLQKLAALFASADIRSGVKPQHLKTFEECVK